MCMQCAATAAVAVGSASGIRAWIRARGERWATAARMRTLTAGLVVVAVLVAGLA
jgi:hypothetical protein